MYYLLILLFYPHLSFSSEFWAQEMSGSHLVRKEFENQKINIDLEKKILVIDTSKESHGEKVANLIAGPFASALIPAKQTIKYKDIDPEDDSILESETFHESLEKTLAGGLNSHADIFNLSLDLGSVSTTKSFHEIALAKHLVIAGGNEFSKLTQLKSFESPNSRIVLAQSLDPNGRISDFSQIQPYFSVCAPAGKSIISHLNNGKKASFGGTSASAPQIAAAIGMFEERTSYKLNGKELKKLLKLTSRPLAHLPKKNLACVGMINPIYIFEVSQKLLKLCQKGERSCLRAKLKRNSTFQIDRPTLDLKSWTTFLTNEAPTENEIYLIKKLMMSKDYFTLFQFFPYSRKAELYILHTYLQHNIEQKIIFLKELFTATHFSLLGSKLRKQSIIKMNAKELKSIFAQEPLLMTKILNFPVLSLEAKRQHLIHILSISPITDQLLSETLNIFTLYFPKFLKEKELFNAYSRASIQTIEPETFLLPFLVWIKRQYPKINLKIWIENNQHLATAQKKQLSLALSKMQELVDFNVIPAFSN